MVVYKMNKKLKNEMNKREGSRKCHQRVFRMQKGFPQNRCTFSFFLNSPLFFFLRWHWCGGGNGSGK